MYDDLADVNLLISSFVHINQSSQEGKVLFPLGVVCLHSSPVEACVCVCVCVCVWRGGGVDQRA